MHRRSAVERFENFAANAGEKPGLAYVQEAEVIPIWQTRELPRDLTPLF